MDPEWVGIYTYVTETGALFIQILNGADIFIDASCNAASSYLLSH